MSSNTKYLKKIYSGVKPNLGDQFEKFLLLATRYNSKINLFSKNTPVEKHLADSYLGMEAILKLLDPKDIQTIYDFGSGNGFPGLVGAMMEPVKRFILVEKNQKKAQFLKTAIDELGLENAEVFNGRTCSLGRACVQFGMSRAMSPIPRFLIETQNITTVGGKIFLFKGKNWEKEAKACSFEALKFWQIKKIGSYTLENQQLFIIACLRI